MRMKNKTLVLLRKLGLVTGLDVGERSSSDLEGMFRQFLALGIG